MIKKGDLVRFKDWHGGHIGRVYRVRIDANGDLRLLVMWYTNDQDKLHEEHEDVLEVISKADKKCP